MVSGTVVAMSKIDRYSLKFNGGDPDLFIVGSGNWVKYSDHMAAVRTLRMQNAGYLVAARRARKLVRSLIQRSALPHEFILVVNKVNLWFGPEIDEVE